MQCVDPTAVCVSLYAPFACAAGSGTRNKKHGCTVPVKICKNGSCADCSRLFTVNCIHSLPPPQLRMALRRVV